MSSDDLDSKDLEDIFEQERLDYKKMSNNTWQITYAGETSDFRVVIEKNKHGLTLKISPYVFSPDDKACKLALYTYLLRLNGQIHHTKFNLEKSGHVSLSMESAYSKKTLSFFHRTLKTLCAYADTHYLDVLNLAQSGHHP